MQKIFKSINDLLIHNPAEQFIVTIGNFDGVHQGHQQLIKQVLDERNSLKAKAIVVTFNPHPTFILRNPGAYLLTDYDLRNELLLSYGIDFVVELNFNRDFSTLTPEKFLDNYIFVSPKIKKLFIGYDFVFGKNKSGDIDFVETYSRDNKLLIHREDALAYAGEAISSTRIRKDLSSGAIATVNKFLNRNFVLSGTVVKGKGRGKVIGFPTANVSCDKKLLLPKGGVYISRTSITGMSYLSVTNIGINPTFGDETQISVENHILDFNDDIYGIEINIEFIERLRSEKKFDSVNDLISQIKEDTVAVREYFAKK